MRDAVLDSIERLMAGGRLGDSMLVALEGHEPIDDADVSLVRAWRAQHAVSSDEPWLTVEKCG